MSKPVDQIITEFCDTFHAGARFAEFVSSAEAEGYPQIAKMFRAVVVSEDVREQMLRKFLPNKVEHTWDYFVCPHCGLIYESYPPDPCPVDETPAASFLHIS